MKRIERFNILMLVPANCTDRTKLQALTTYGIEPEKIGRYFGEQKEIRE